MKKIVFALLFVFLFTVLPVTGQADELAGTWIGFLGPDFIMIRFSQDGENLSYIDTLNDLYTEYNGPYKAEDQSIFFAFFDGESQEMKYSFENGKLILDWNGVRTYTRIDDSFYPADPDASPYIGENRKYMIEMTEDGGIRICEYFGDEETVEIPSAVFGIPVTEMGEYSVTQKQEMKHLILPDGIKKIAANAFADDISLEDVRLPETLESIGYGAFQYCYSMEEVVIPEGVKVIEDSAFWQCNGLKRIALPESLEETWPESFYGDDRLRFFVKADSYAEQFCQENGFKYSVPDSEIWEQIYRDGEIPAEAMPPAADPELIGTWIEFSDDDFYFYRFSPKGDLTMVESNGYYPYSSSGSWESDGETITFVETESGYDEEIPYYFEDGILHMDWRWERICSRVDDMYFPAEPYDTPYLGEDKIWWISQMEDGTIRINGYGGMDETVVIPESVFGFPVTAIRDTAFMSSERLKHVIIPHGVTFIGYQAFSYNDELESVELPDTLRTIEYSAFMFSPKLKEIVIPEGVTFLDSDTFLGCESLETVVLPESLEAVDETGAFDYRTQDSIHFVVPAGSFAEEYCRENDLNCFTADGVRLTGSEVSGGDDVVPDDGYYKGPSEDPYEETYSEPVYGDEALYNEAMALYDEEKYYSARQKFLMSGYADAEEMAEKCIQAWPSTGEIWHDRSQWLQDMELTIVVNQPEDTGMLIRIFKDNAPVSSLFLAGSDSVTVRLPGNGYYEIMDGVGYNWYGIEEAFGGDGRYEIMTFDDAGTKRVFLQSYYAYTLSINVSEPTPGGEDVYSETIDYSKFLGGQAAGN